MTETRQMRRAARRKTEILEAAAKVFTEKGFQRSTTKDIAEAADIAEGTIYNYFESKEDLLINLIDWIADLESRRRAYEKSLEDDFQPVLREMLFARLNVIQERNKLFLAILPELFITPHLRDLYVERVMTPAVRDLEEHLQARIERHQIQDVDVSVMVRMMSALGLGLEVLAILGDEEIQALWAEPSKMVDILADIILHGMLPLRE